MPSYLDDSGVEDLVADIKTLADGTYQPIMTYVADGTNGALLGDIATNTASGNYSVAEGNNTEASGYYSHAEGRDTIASNNQAHAGGYGSEATAVNSFAHGSSILASAANQFAVGQYNEELTTDGLFIVGNGDSTSARSNALVVKKTGRIKAGADAVNSDELVRYGQISDMLNFFSLFNKQLTMSKSSWSSGTCTITNISKYNVVVIVSSEPILMARVPGGSVFRGSLITGSGTQYGKDFYFTISGDTCTYGNGVQLTHTASGGHSSASTGQAITACYGIIPA